jgi:hypothetical protein
MFRICDTALPACVNDSVEVENAEFPAPDEVPDLFNRDEAVPVTVPLVGDAVIALVFVKALR